MNDEVKNEKNDVTDEVIRLYEEFVEKVDKLKESEFNCAVVAQLCIEESGGYKVSNLQVGKSMLLYKAFDSFIESLYERHGGYVLLKLMKD